MRIAGIVIGLIVVALSGLAALGATITLKDGTVLTGTLIREDGGYQIKFADGTSREVSDDEVTSIGTGSADGGSAGTVGASDEFRVAKNRADAVKSPLPAVAIWQQFIDKNPDSPDMALAKQEMAHWQSLADSGAEKVNGVWVGGAQLRRMREEAHGLTKDAHELWAHSQTLQGIAKLREAVKVYPNSFEANFALGWLTMVQHNYEDAIPFFQVSVRLMPQSAEAQNNLAVANFFCRRFEEGIEGLQKAVEIKDNKMIAQNLVTALVTAPSDVRTMPKFKTMRTTADLLAAKYGLSGPATWMLIEPADPTASIENQALPPSTIGGGTGFLITDDGLILTNRHVAKAGPTLTVLMGGKRYPAEVAGVDDDYDLALVRIKSTEKLPFARLSPEDSPPDGADCTVIGFPLFTQIGLNVKITHGIVSSSSSNAGNGADVFVDAKVNHGNSGGPMLDKYGNVMAIVCMRTFSSAEDDSYGIGISAGHIREFLDRRHVSLPAGDEVKELSTEQVVAKVKAATVCILVSK